MRKIHARMSVEIEVSEKEFEQIVDRSRLESNDVYLEEWMIARAKPCDWDDGGYIPGPWLEDDIYYPEGDE